jgi:MoxR-like ATPase
LGIVLATQNPIEYEGTYPLPEAQIDRFLMKLNMGYPNETEEFEILQRMEIEDLADVKINKITTPQDITKMQQIVKKVHINDDLKKYIVRLVQKTRSESRIDVGISPRGSIAVFKLAKAHAAFYGRDYVVPDDVKNVIIPALSHRLILKAETRIRGIKPEMLIMEFLQKTPVPTVG